MSRINFGSLSFDEARAELMVNGKSVALAPRERKLLVASISLSDWVATRGELLDRIWGMERADAGSHALTVSIQRLRKALGPYAFLIVTVHGEEYRLDGVPCLMGPPGGTGAASFDPLANPF